MLHRSYSQCASPHFNNCASPRGRAPNHLKRPFVERGLEARRADFPSTTKQDAILLPGEHARSVAFVLQGSSMPRKSTHQPRPSDVVMDELPAERIPWDLNDHLNGCLAGYQTTPSYGAAVFFALEALWHRCHRHHPDRPCRTCYSWVGFDLLARALRKATTPQPHSLAAK